MFPLFFLLPRRRVSSSQKSSVQTSLDNNFFFGATSSVPPQRPVTDHNDPFVGLSSPSTGDSFPASSRRNDGLTTMRPAPEKLATGHIEDPFASLLAPIGGAPSDIPTRAPPPMPLYDAPVPAASPPTHAINPRQSNPFMDDDDAIAAPPASEDLWGAASVPQRQAPAVDIWGSVGSPPISKAPVLPQPAPSIPPATGNSLNFDVFSSAPLVQAPAVPASRTPAWPPQDQPSNRIDPFGNVASSGVAPPSSQHSVADLDLFSSASFSEAVRPAANVSGIPFAAPPPPRATIGGPPQGMPTAPFAVAPAARPVPAAAPAPVSADPFSGFPTRTAAPRAPAAVVPPVAPKVDPFFGGPSAAAPAPASPAPSANPFSGGDDDPFGVFSPGKPAAAAAPSRAAPAPAAAVRPPPPPQSSAPPPAADPFAAFPAGNNSSKGVSSSSNFSSSDPFGRFPSAAKPVENDDPFGVFSNSSKPSASAGADFFSPGGTSSNDETDDAMKRFRDAYGGPVSVDADVDERTHPQKGVQMPKGGRYASHSEVPRSKCYSFTACSFYAPL
jgi:hypothetical protein